MSIYQTVFSNWLNHFTKHSEIDNGWIFSSTLPKSFNYAFCTFILMRLKWYVIVDLICSFLVADDVEYLCMYIFVILYLLQRTVYLDPISIFHVLLHVVISQRSLRICLFWFFLLFLLLIQINLNLSSFSLIFSFVN